jgi:single-stranded DNA-binding protein
MNAVALVGTVGAYGVKIAWTDAGKPQASFSLVVSELGPDGRAFTTFVPVLVVGAKAEAAAEALEPGDMVAVAGKLAYKAGKTKDAGRLVVVTYAVERLTEATIPHT